MDTIFALASAPGKSGVAVIRVSGPLAWECCRRLAGALPNPRQASLRVLRDSEGGVFDEALVLVFEEDQSFTGEAVVEFQTHGSRAVVQAVIAELGMIEGCRLAEAGEFTRRALANNRMDLTQAEGLADLIDAETEVQRRQAQRVFSGAIGQIVKGWRAELIRAAALLEASIDFSDEELPDGVIAEARNLLSKVRTDIARQMTGISVSERVRDGFEVAILGRPNIGKSTLLNYLAGREAALTSDIAGTTRDIIEVRMDLKGIPVTFLDTAGLRDADDAVERLGVDRAKARGSAADLRVFLLALGETPAADLIQDQDISVVGRSDERADGGGVSGLTGAGVRELLDRIHTVLDERVSGASVFFRDRQRKSLADAVESLERAEAELGHGEGRLEIAAEEARSAVLALEIMIGQVDSEQILDEIFSSFCIGK